MGRRNKALFTTQKPKERAEEIEKLDQQVKSLDDFFAKAKKWMGGTATEFDFRSLALPHTQLKKLAEFGKMHAANATQQLERTFGRCLHPETNTSRSLFFSSALCAILVVAETCLALANRYREKNDYAKMLLAEERAIDFFRQYFELYQLLAKDKLFALWGNTRTLLFNPELSDPEDMQFAENYHRFANSDPLFKEWKIHVAKKTAAPKNKELDAKLWRDFNDWKMNEYLQWNTYVKEITHGAALEHFLEVYSDAITHCSAKDFSHIEDDEVNDSPEFAAIQDPRKARDFCIDAASLCGQAMNLPYTRGNHGVQAQKVLKDKSCVFTRMSQRLLVEFPQLVSQPYKLR